MSPAPERELRSDALRNRERLVQAAVRAVHREGLGVPMATIAAEAGVGVGTLYRHFSTREELLDELTYRSFALMLTRIQHARSVADTATATLRAFLTAVIADRHDMLLPSSGGPAVGSRRTRALQRQLHRDIEDVIRLGATDGTIQRPVDVSDITWLGATLAPPGRTGQAWEAISFRLLDTYLAGMGVP